MGDRLRARARIGGRNYGRFDTALAQRVFHQPVEIGRDDNADVPACYVLKLHGDYKDARILNTEAELSGYPAQYDSLLDRILDEHCQSASERDPPGAQWLRTGSLRRFRRGMRSAPAQIATRFKSASSPSRRRLARLVPDAVRRRAPGLRRLSPGAPRPGTTAGPAGALRQRLCQQPSLRGLRRDLGHYLHIVDTLETAGAFGLRVDPSAGRDPPLAMAMDFDPYRRQHEFDALIRAWLPLTFAVNSMNQSMGLPDLYPFVLAPTVMASCVSSTA